MSSSLITCSGSVMDGRIRPPSLGSGSVMEPVGGWTDISGSLVGSGSVMDPIGGWTDFSGSLLVLAVSWNLLVDGRTFLAPFWFWQCHGPYWWMDGHFRLPFGSGSGKRVSTSRCRGPTTFLRLIELGGQLTIASAHLPHKGRQLGELGTLLAQIQTFVHERARQHWILGGAFNATFGLTDFHHVGESTPRPDTLTDTKRFLRPRALHTVEAEVDLTVTNTWMGANSEQELYRRKSWTEPMDAQTHMDFVMASRILVAKKLQVLDFDWFKSDHWVSFHRYFVEIPVATLSENWSEFWRMEADRPLAKKLLPRR